MKKMVLDLYCCGGGAGYGYWLAGADVTGVDKFPQPNYPFEFVQADAIEYLKEHGHLFDLIHLSPPCQGWSPLNAYNKAEYPMLIGPTRDVLPAGVPYVIENVHAARNELIDPMMLCGPMFGLKVYRHRMFETSFPVFAPDEPEHRWLCSRNGYLPTPERPFMSIHGGKHSRAWQRKACEVMGTPWLSVPLDAGVARIQQGVREVCEAIPPAYTEWIATQWQTGLP